MSAEMNGGQIIVNMLENQGVDRVFCVPGESYLPVLDALQESPIECVLARHEGGAAMMADADGKLTGRPGIVLVTRGPGACNASAGIHIAQQDSTPVIMFVGQVARQMRGRDAFQEVDFTQMFGDMAKMAVEVENAADLEEVIATAFRVAMEGRPGPVVISLPEDMLYDMAPAPSTPRITVEHAPPTADAIATAIDLLAQAENPMVIAGGSVWSADDIAMLSQFAANYSVPVACSFRRQRLMHSLDPHYAGDLGLGCNPKLLSRIRAADCLILLGGRLSEIPSQSYTLIDIPIPQMRLIHVHPDASEIGRVYTPGLGIVTSPGQFLAAMMDGMAAPAAVSPCPEHLAYRDWTEAMPTPPGLVNMAEIVRHLRETLPPESIMTNGAGNYATWLHRYYHFRHHQCQLAPTSGSMGYGIPAAVAAKARFPERVVVAFAGDGCFQMSMQELATASQIDAQILVLVVDNGMYGTIRMHQEREFPGRTRLTELVNPEFTQLAKSMGMHAEYVVKTEGFPAALHNCMNSGKPSLIHLTIDPEAISPMTTLTAIRENSKKA